VWGRAADRRPEEGVLWEFREEEVGWVGSVAGWAGFCDLSVGSFQE
jgi:hypothetical protein